MRFRGLVSVVSVCAGMLGGGFVLAVTPALAAAPETPEALKPAPLMATSAVLHGLLNPGKEGPEGTFEKDTYEFVYRQSSTECKGAGEILTTAGLSLGGGKEEVSQGTEGLTANTPYTVCVVVHNEAKTETAISAPVTFTTALPPETPEELTGEPVGTGVKLRGILNPANQGNPGTYEFLYRQSGQSAPECTGGQSTPPQAATGAVREVVEGEVTGLLPNTEYAFCLRARNEAGEESAPSTPITLTTLAVAPSVEGESFSNVGSSSATLHAQVDSGGAPTTFFFEYGPTTAYGATTPLESAGAGATPGSVLASIEQLQPDTEYHFRVVLNSTHGEAQGVDTIFFALPLAASGLPDGRGYELVSPLNNGDATIVPGRAGVRATADGSKVTYLSTTPPTGGVGHGEPPPAEINQGTETVSGDNQYLSVRPAAGGWTTTNIQPPGVNTAVYQSFSSDLSEAVLQSIEPLTKNAPGGKYPGFYTQSAAGGGYSSLFTRTPSHLASPEQFKTRYAGPSADGLHQLFEANDALLEGATPTAEELNMFAGEKAVNPLYDSTGGRLVAVDVLPNGHVAPQATYGSPPQKAGALSVRLDHVVSTDGSRIFWTDTSTEVNPEDPAGVTRLFMREDDASPGASTVQIDASEVPVGSGATETKERQERGGAGSFMTASANGKKVYFTDDRRLTANSVAAPGEPDLYLYDFEASEGQHLTDLTTDVQHVGERANVVGVLGASDDGSYVYFAAAGALARGAKAQECVEGAFCNVYVVHTGESPNFVATVTYNDGEGNVADPSQSAIPVTLTQERAGGDWVPGVGDRTAQVSSDGRHLVFESIAIESVANQPDFDGGGSREIYIYDFGSSISCVSCNPTGVPALGAEPYARHFELPESFSSIYALHFLSNNGDRVFFNSKEALVPDDENNRTDVYEWERSGSGSCVRVKGCLFLLSGGTSGEYSALLDASASGDNVFIASRAQLVPRVHGEVYEVYDVRVGAPRESAPLVCSGTGCQGVPGAPPIFATPSSVTFNGVGNFTSSSAGPPPHSLSRAEKLAKALKSCRKGRARKKRAGCERSARRRFGVSKTRKASVERGVK